MVKTKKVAKKTTKKKVAKTKVVAKAKQTKKITINKPKQVTGWGGIGSGGTPEVSAFCNQVAKVYGIPVTGVNSMKGKPYINREGRLYLMNEMKTGKKALLKIQTEILNMALNLDSTAIVMKRLIFKDGLVIEAIGEASKDNVTKEGVKSSLNMMAETRALNRAIGQAIDGDLWNRIEKNIEDQNIQEKDIETVINAGRVSYEEMQQPDAEVVTPSDVKASEPSDLKDVILGGVETAFLKKSIDNLTKIDQQTQKSDLDKKFKKEVHSLCSLKVKELKNNE